MGSGNKQKRYVTFFVENKETGIRELDLIARAASVAAGGKADVDTADFIRGAALDLAARIVLTEAARIRAEQKKKEEAASGSDANGAQAADGQGSGDAVPADAGAGVAPEAGGEAAEGTEGAEAGADVPAAEPAAGG